MKALYRAALAMTVALVVSLTTFGSTRVNALTPIGVDGPGSLSRTTTSLVTEARVRSRLVVVIKPRHRHCHLRIVRVCVKWRRGHCVKSVGVLRRVCHR